MAMENGEWIMQGLDRDDEELDAVLGWAQS